MPGPGQGPGVSPRYILRFCAFWGRKTANLLLKFGLKSMSKEHTLFVFIRRRLPWRVQIPGTLV